jgi:DNA replicative helicase MCM subunit Mcm2 (Cdc46/Mcm family)
VDNIIKNNAEHNNLPPPNMQFPLNQTQREQAERLWRCQLREAVDVRPSKELNPALQQKSGIGSGQELGFICILHEFFLAHHHVVLGKNHPSQKFLRYVDNPVHSSLGGYVRLALKSAESQSPDSHPTQKVVALWEGRRVVFLHHDDFLGELDHFMCQSKGIPEVTNEWRRKDGYGAYLHFRPEQALAAIGVAMRLSMMSLAQILSIQSNLQDRFLDFSQLQVRFTHMAWKTNMMDIKTGSVGKLITVKGHVVKARPKRLRIATADFACQKCGASQIHAFHKGKYSTPTKCVNMDCKSRSFTLEKKQATYHNVQEIRLQEAQEESTLHSGRTPRQIPVELCHDLVDSCRPGDTVMVACIVDAINAAMAAGRTGRRAKENSTFTLVLLGHSITTLSETTSQNGRGRSSNGQQQFSQQQLESITQLCHADHKFFSMTERRAFPFDLLVRSICPAIVGHHEVKAGILLCLLGGTPPAASFRKNSGEIRSNSHMLIVGDPGMGKSQMLLAASQLAARSVFVGGNTSSTTGLTVTLTKEEGGESGLEAGALVLADNGLCCLDEFGQFHL